MGFFNAVKDKLKETGSKAGAWTKKGAEDAKYKSGEGSGAWSDRNLPTFKPPVVAGAQVAKKAAVKLADVASDAADAGADGAKKGWAGIKWSFGKAKSGASAVASASSATAGFVAGGARKMGSLGTKAMTKLSGRYTWLFAILVILSHGLLLMRGIFSFGDPLFYWYIILAFLAALVFYSDPGVEWYVRLGKFMLVTVVSYWLPAFLDYMRHYVEVLDPVFRILLLFASIWIWFVILNPADAGTRVIAVIIWGGLVLWMVFGLIVPTLAGTTPSLSTGSLLTWSDMKDMTASFIYKGKQVAVDTPKAIYNYTQQAINGSYNRVTQEYYQGQVDQSQGIPLGVQLIEPQPALQKFAVDLGDDVSGTVSVRARTINEDPIKIVNTCSLNVLDSSNIFKPVMVPVGGMPEPQTMQFGYTGATFDQQLYVCTVPNKNISEVGFQTNIITGTLIWNTTFQFSTTGYMTLGFMDRNLINSLRYDGKDPAQVLGIQSRALAHYTPGPVMIGMPSDTLPYPYEAETSTGSNSPLPAFGITFANAYQGRGGIQNFTYIAVHLPRIFKLETSDGSCTPTGALVKEAGASPMGSEYHMYLVSNLSRRPGEQYVTIRCPLRIADGQKKNVLGPSGGGIYTFLVTANYTYAIDTQSSVTLVVKPMQTMSSLGIPANIRVLANRAACTNPSDEFCRGAQGDPTAQCVCTYKTDAATLSQVVWPRGDTSSNQYNAGKNDTDSVTIVDGKIPKECTSIGCKDDGSCGCEYIAKDNGRRTLCTWQFKPAPDGPLFGFDCKRQGAPVPDTPAAPVAPNLGGLS